MRFTLLFTIPLIIIRATSISSLPGTYTTITFFFSHHNTCNTKYIVKNRNIDIIILKVMEGGYIWHDDYL